MRKIINPNQEKAHLVTRIAESFQEMLFNESFPKNAVYQPYRVARSIVNSETVTTWRPFLQEWNERLWIGGKLQNMIDEMLKADPVHLSIVVDAAVGVHRKNCLVVLTQQIKPFIILSPYKTTSNENNQGKPY